MTDKNADLPIITRPVKYINGVKHILYRGKWMAAVAPTKEEKE